jgi:hypothetical protein
MADIAAPEHATTQFLAETFAVCETGWINIFTITDGPPESDWATVAQPETAAAHALSRVEQGNVYFGVATRKARVPGRRRGRLDDCHELPALYADIDIAGVNHATDDAELPKNEAEAQALIRAIGLAPSAVIHSGGGLQAYWFFQEAHPVTELTDLVARWTATLMRHSTEVGQRHGAPAGWHLDNVFNLDRVMRVPGTINYKQHPTLLPVEVIEANYHRRYGLDDVTEILDEPPVEPKAAPTFNADVRYIGPDRPGDAFTQMHKNDIGGLLRQYGFVEVGRPDRNGDTYWKRPGSKARHNLVAHRNGKVANFSSSIPLPDCNQPDGHPVDAYGLYTHLSHGGDFKAAASELRRLGYGASHQPDDLSWASPLTTPTVVSSEKSENDDEPVDEVWEDPEPLEPTLQHGPPFPVGLLPAWMGDMAKEISEALLVPVDLPAVAILGALSTVTQTKVRAELTGTTWSEDTNLYLMCGFPSGGGKSPAFAAAMAPLEAFEASRIEEMRPVIEEAEMKRDILIKKAKVEEDGAVKGSVTVERALAAKAEATDVVVPPSPAFIVEDATPEALGQHLDECGGRGAILSSEGDLVDDFAGRYATQGKGAPLGVYLKPWGGESIRVKRVGRGLIRLPSTTLTICVMPQPILLRRLGENSETGERGLNARFLYSVPASNIGWRQYGSLLRPANSEVRQTYERTLVQLAERFTRHSFPLVLKSTPEATQRWITWMDETEKRLRPGGDLEGMSGWIAKLRASTLRLAALLHIADGTKRETLEPADLERAFELADYWIAHYKAVHAVWVRSEELGVERAHQIIKWATDRELDEFSVRDVHQALKQKGTHGKNEPVESFVAPLQYLVDTGWLRADAGFPTTVGRRGVPSPRLTLHPEAKRYLSHAPQPSTEPQEQGDVGHQLRGMRVEGKSQKEISTTTTAEFTRDEHEDAAYLNPHAPQLAKAAPPESAPPSVAIPSSAPDFDDEFEEGGW